MSLSQGVIRASSTVRRQSAIRRIPPRASRRRRRRAADDVSCREPIVPKYTRSHLPTSRFDDVSRGLASTLEQTAARLRSRQGVSTCGVAPPGIRPHGENAAIQLTEPAMTATRSAPADVRAGATLEVALVHADTGGRGAVLRGGLTLGRRRLMRSTLRASAMRVHVHEDAPLSPRQRASRLRGMRRPRLRRVALSVP
jgi:hypothetical protein